VEFGVLSRVDELDCTRKAGGYCLCRDFNFRRGIEGGVKSGGWTLAARGFWVEDVVERVT